MSLGAPGKRVEFNDVVAMLMSVRSDMLGVGLGVESSLGARDIQFSRVRALVSNNDGGLRGHEAHKNCTNDVSV